MNSTEQKLVYAFERGHDTDVLAYLHNYRGRLYADLRIWFAEDGELHPTRRGLRLPVDELPKLREAIDALLEAAAHEAAA